MSDAQDHEYVKAGEAAKLFGTTPKTLKRILIDEQIPVLHLRGQYLVKRSDVLALKAARTRPITNMGEEVQKP